MWTRTFRGASPTCKVYPDSGTLGSIQFTVTYSTELKQLAVHLIRAKVSLHFLFVSLYRIISLFFFFKLIKFAESKSHGQEWILGSLRQASSNTWQCQSDQVDFQDHRKNTEPRVGRDVDLSWSDRRGPPEEEPEAHSFGPRQDRFRLSWWVMDWVFICPSARNTEVPEVVISNWSARTATRRIGFGIVAFSFGPELLKQTNYAHSFQ